MAFAAVERLIAFRYLRARREEGFISVIAAFSLIGITLGVGTLIVVMSVMNGFRFEMLRQMSSISGQLGVQGTRGGLDATPELLANMTKVPGVLSATPTAEGQVMAFEQDTGRLLWRRYSPDVYLSLLISQRGCPSVARSAAMRPSSAVIATRSLVGPNAPTNTWLSCGAGSLRRKSSTSVSGSRNTRSRWDSAYASVET